MWAIDALRGLALFGVLAINLDTEFRVTLFEQFLDRPRAAFLDRAAAVFLSYALEFKALALFSLLFGVGLAIQYERFEKRPDRTVLLVRRLVALLAFGLIHLFLIWNGDILTEYALAGLIALPLLLFLPARALLAGAIVLLLIYIAVPWLPLPFNFPDNAWMSAHAVQARDAYGAGNFLDVLSFRIAEVPEVGKLLTYVFPRTLALILFGAWLHRSGAISKLAKHRNVTSLAGLLLIGLGLLFTAQDSDDLHLFAAGPAASSAVSVAAALLVAFGYAALVLALGRKREAPPALRWAVPVGRMAFSNYIAQSIVLGVIFYGYGLGLMGEVGAAAGLGIAIVIFAVQARLSALWLRSHRFGPLEWLWRSLMYGRHQTWRVAAA
jgi:uncharacterized protein